MAKYKITETIDKDPGITLYISTRIENKLNIRVM